MAVVNFLATTDVSMPTVFAPTEIPVPAPTDHTWPDTSRPAPAAVEFAPENWVHVEVEDPTSALLVLDSVDVDTSVLAIRAGTFRFRVRTICPGPERSLTIEARVEP